MAEPLRGTLRRSVLEGVLYALAVGFGEFYLAADAIRLGAGPLEMGLLVTLPQFVGSLGALGMLSGLQGATARRPRVVLAVGLQAGVLLVLTVLTALGLTTPWTLVLLACAYHACGQAAGVAWASWFGDLVPGRVRGAWFARRNRWVHAFTFVGLGLGGLVLQLTEPQAAIADGAGGVGFAVVFGAAAVARLLSAALLARTDEPPWQANPDAPSLWAFARSDAGQRTRSIVSVTGMMLFAVCVSSPFFAPYMLEELRFSYTTYMLAQAVVVGVKVFGLRAWGGAVDRVGPRPVFLVAALMVAIVPSLWVFAGGVAVVLVAQALSGLAWGAYEVALMGLMLAGTDARHRALAFATQSVSNGVAQLLGGAVGTLLFVKGGVGFAAVFALSSLGRLGVAALAPRLLRNHPPGQGRRAAVLWVMGVRPHGGVFHRPVATAGDDEG